MLIDPLNIFQDIKETILLEYVNVKVVCAFGSRVSGVSTGQKWDFDVLVVYEGQKLLPHELLLFLRSKFDQRIDENGKNVKVDVWTLSEDKFEDFKNNTKNVVDVCML